MKDVIKSATSISGPNVGKITGGKAASSETMLRKTKIDEGETKFIPPILKSHYQRFENYAYDKLY